MTGTLLHGGVDLDHQNDSTERVLKVQRSSIVRELNVGPSKRLDRASTESPAVDYWGYAIEETIKTTRQSEY